MKSSNLRMRRWVGVGFIFLALALDLFFWLVAGPRALAIGSSSSVLLFVFGGLFLSGRWPAGRQNKENQ